MMNKKCVSCLLPMLIMSSAFATEAPSSSNIPSYSESLPAGPYICDFKGWSVGTVLGYGFSNIPRKDQELRKLMGDFKPRGFSGGLTLGYMRPFSSSGSKGVFWGFDVTGIVSGEKHSKNASNTLDLHDLDPTIPVGTMGNMTAKSNSKIKYSLEGALRAGYALKRFMPFVRLGFKSLGAGFNFNYSAQAAGVEVVGSDKMRQTFTGLLLGAGVGYKVSSRVILGLDYSAAFYSPKKKKFKMDEGVKKWMQNAFRLTAAYKF